MYQLLYDEPILSALYVKWELCWTNMSKDETQFRPTLRNIVEIQEVIVEI